MNVVFKKTTLDDLETIASQEKSVAGNKTYSALLEEDEIKKYIKEGHVFLILDGSQIIGSIAYQIKSKDHAYIEGLVITPDFQGKGYGTAVINKILEELKNYKIISLVTHPENSNAIMIYLKAGFKIKAWKDNFFGDGEARIELIKEN